MRGPNAFDCSGLTWYVYNEIFGVDINSNGYGLSATTKQMTSDIGNLYLFEKDYCIQVQDFTIGDILFFHRQSLKDNNPMPYNRYPGHCGIYLGNNKFIHALRKQGQILISDLILNNYWSKKLVGRKNLINQKATFM